MYDFVNLFSGAGGWELGAQRIGLTGIGVETNSAARATAVKAGFEVIQKDVRIARPMYGGASKGLIASPPCQTFSSAGNGSGRAEMAKVLSCLRSWAWDGDFADERTGLVLEPLRWILQRASMETHYDWIAMEEVPNCLPIFLGYAEILDSIGYSVAVGKMHAEWFGVPQNRTRAVLIAHRHREISLPCAITPIPPSWAAALNFDRGCRMVSNYKDGNTGNRGVRWGSEPSFAVTSKINRNRIIFPDGSECRLTPEGAGILQGFPGWYPWQGKRSEQYEQIGNAIPPPLAEALLRALIEL